MLRFLLAVTIFFVVGLQPVRASAAPISFSNADRVEQLGQIGYGTIYQLDWFDSEDELFVGASTGVWLYDNVSFETNLPTLLASPTDGKIDDFSYFNGVTITAMETTERNPDDREVVIFRSDTNQASVIDNQQGYIGKATLSQDGLLLAVVRLQRSNYHAVIHIWNTQTTELIQSFDLGSFDSLDFIPIEFSPDNTRLAVFVYNIQGQGIHVWDVRTGAELLNAQHDGTRALAFSQDSRYLLAAGVSFAMLTLWDIDTAQEVFSVQTGGDTIFEIAFSPRGELLATSNNADNTVRIWSTSTGEEIATLQNGGFFISFNHNGELLASVGPDNVIKIWSVEAWTEINTLTGFLPPIAAVAFNPIDDSIALGGASTLLQIWDTQTMTQSLILPSESRVNHVTFSSDGARLFVSNESRRVEYWNILNASGPYHAANCDCPIVFSPDGMIVAMGTQLRDAETLEQVQTFNTGDYSINDVAFSSDGSMFATVSGSHPALGTDLDVAPDGALRLWDITTGSELATFEDQTVAISAVVFSPDGHLLASGDDNGEIKLWAVESRTQLATLQGHTGWVTTLAFSTDGSLLISGSLDHTIRLWDVATMTEVRNLEGNTDIVTDLSLNADGTLLASAGWDGTARLWGIPESE
jgi:WD40 repeat protein